MPTSMTRLSSVRCNFTPNNPIYRHKKSYNSITLLKEQTDASYLITTIFPSTFFVLYVPCPLPGSHPGLRKDDFSGNGSDNYLGIFRQIGKSYKGMAVGISERNRISVNIEADGYREITPVGVIGAGPPIIDAVPV
jgi:hypothetical protein